MLNLRLGGLVAATHTPFRADGALNLAVVEAQAAHLQEHEITAAFIGGTTGESHSLLLEERQALTQCWLEVTRGSRLGVVVHVGSNCLGEARALAVQAERLGARAIAALAPSYFKPRTLAALLEWCAQIAGAAPATPFYFYDIPALTGVSLPMPEFLEQAADRIPTLAGLKYTNSNLMDYQLCLHACEGAFDMLWGTDEALLAGLTLGARGAVGSSYNFAAPIYRRLLAAFARGDWENARREQFASVQLISLLYRYGYPGAAKAVLDMLGIDVGPARPPQENLSRPQKDRLRADLERLGFFDWITPPGPGGAGDAHR
ncbi:MAG: N-acetylneuraminate lyase [Verrucomicrobia bacterium]|nr:N-acetylneuraminate lyase [Verrucomicrobiota bacterium]